MIKPVVLKGFRDSLPKQEMAKKKIIRKLEDVFTSYGFVPIDTPALELSEILLGKGGGETDKQVFSFQDNGGRNVAMRFDLTVPFARFIAQNFNSLNLPFKRFHINKVWRGENPQKGRYREFIQCDFDIVGLNNALSDFEILSLMAASFNELGLSNYTFHLSHRGLLNEFLNFHNIADKNTEILRLIDKLRKIGEEEVVRQLTELTNDAELANKVIAFITYDKNEEFLSTLERMETLSGGESVSSQRVKEVYALLEGAGIAKHFSLDPSITRGLDYYTGIVYETFLDELPSFGSVCSGGRYDNLTALYTKEVVPGVGSSIGLDRLVAALEELDSPIVKEVAASDAIIFFDKDNNINAFNLAKELRANGLRINTFLAQEKKFKAQWAYVERENIPYVVSFGNEFKYAVKNAKTREYLNTNEVSDLVAFIKDNK